MPAICCICNDDKINYNNKCLTCRKCVCDECFGKIIYRTELRGSDYDPKYETNRLPDGYYCIYKCPFCKTENTINIKNLEKEHIISIFEDNIEKYDDLNDRLIEENNILEGNLRELVEEIEELQVENKNLKNVNDNLRRYIQKLKEIKVKEGITEEELNKVKIEKRKGLTYQEFFKENFKLYKTANPTMLSKDIMKEVGMAWQSYKERIKNDI